jgi:hypothetical protein
MDLSEQKNIVILQSGSNRPHVPGEIFSAFSTFFLHSVPGRYFNKKIYKIPA